MLVIETPSQVKPRDGARRQEALAPIVVESEILGRGAFGIVFGPYSATRIRDILMLLYISFPVQGNCVEELYRRTGIDFSVDGRKAHSIGQVLPEGSSYILKTELKKAGESRLCEPSILLAEKIQKLPALYRRSFIYPLVCGQFSWGRFEVQRYGGKELYRVLKDGKAWTNPQRLVPILQSMLYIIQGCFALVDDHEILITDMKPGNMAYDETTGALSLIDLEYATLKKEETKRVVFTLHPSYIPLQFLNRTFFTSRSNRERFVKEYVGFKGLPKSQIKNQLLQVDRDTLVKVSKFTIVWACVNILHLIVSMKYEAHPSLIAVTTKMKDDLKKKPRWRGSMKVFIRKIEAFCDLLVAQMKQ